MHYESLQSKKGKKLINLGLFSDMQNSIKIIEWPNLIKKTPLSDKLEIHMSYGKKEYEREIKLIASGKWQNFK